MQFDKELDASGLLCPIPIIKAKQALSTMACGQVLRVVSTDPRSLQDIKALTRKTGDLILGQAAEDTKFVFYLRKN